MPHGSPPAPAQAWRNLDGPIDQLALFQSAHAITKVGAGEERVLVERFDGDALDARRATRFRCCQGAR